MAVRSTVFRRIHGRFATLLIILWLITSGQMPAQAQSPQPHHAAAALDAPAGPGAFAAGSGAHSPDATVNVASVTTIEQFYLNRLTATYVAHSTGTFPSTYSFTPPKATISDLVFSHTGPGTCRLGSNNTVRCSGEISSLTISFRYVMIVEPKGIEVEITAGQTSTIYGAMKADLRYPSSLACLRSTLPPTLKAVGLLRWEQANTNKLNPTISFRVGTDCANLKPLEDDYRRKIGKNNEWYSHFWLCLNTNACGEYLRTGEDGPAGGFGKYMFDYMKAHSENSALHVTCPLLTHIPVNNGTKLACFLYTGASHFKNELGPGFLSYAKGIDPAEFDKWDVEHDAFVAAYNVPCYRDVLQTTFPDNPLLRDSLISSLQEGTKRSATLLRETIQWAVLTGRDSQARSATAVLSASYPLAPTYQELFSPDLLAASALKATAADNAFFLPVGSATQLVVSGLPAAARSATTYTILGPADVATITADGLLTVHATTSPLLNERPLLRVLVQNGGLSGIAQFAIQDSDADGDLLADSYEVAAGLSSAQPNGLDADLDSDGLSDHWELIMHSDPRLADTDRDGSSDSAEFAADSDLLNPNCTPKGCVYPAFLPALRR